MWRLKGGWKVDGTQGVSYTTGTNNLQAMIAKVGIHVARLSDKSVKSLAVTKAMRKGMTADSTREHGRWKPWTCLYTTSPVLLNTKKI
jgi:hypothetical protein